MSGENLRIHSHEYHGVAKPPSNTTFLTVRKNIEDEIKTYLREKELTYNSNITIDNNTFDGKGLKIDIILEKDGKKSFIYYSTHNQIIKIGMDLLGIKNKNPEHIDIIKDAIETSVSLNSDLEKHGQPRLRGGRRRGSLKKKSKRRNSRNSRNNRKTRNRH